MAGEIAPRDQNYIAVIQGVSSLDLTAPTNIAVNPSTHAMLVEAVITPSGTQDTNLVKVGGAAITLGQKAMATSLPVVIASDQASIPVAATLTAETTKVIGTVNQGTSPWVVSGIISTKTALTAAAPTAATVGVATAQAVASNASRKGLILTNTSVNTISFGIGASAVLNSGITLYPGGTWQMDEGTFTLGAINAIASAASSNLAVQELT